MELQCNQFEINEDKIKVLMEKMIHKFEEKVKEQPKIVKGTYFRTLNSDMNNNDNFRHIKCIIKSKTKKKYLRPFRNLKSGYVYIDWNKNCIDFETNYDPVLFMEMLNILSKGNDEKIELPKDFEDEFSDKCLNMYTNFTMTKVLRDTVTIYSQEEYLNQISFKRKQLNDEDDYPCSEQCYKIMNLPNNYVLWTEIERMDVSCRLKSIGKKYCKIANGLPTKSCIDIYRLTKDMEIPSNRDREFKAKKVKLDNKSKLKILESTIKKWSAEEEKKSLYTPCDHDGVCDEDCSCFLAKNFCEKLCACQPDCINKFPGCQCLKGQCDSSRCPCYVALRECDPDICKCHKDKMCKNQHLLIGSIGKKLLVRESKVSGYGAFTDEDILKNEFIKEYTGEIISDDEANEREENIYKEMKKSYVFLLSMDYSLDAFFCGNVTRFINHSQRPNCYVKILTVNCCQRIAFFAKQDIKRGEELLFDYKYDEQHKNLFFK